MFYFNKQEKISKIADREKKLQREWGREEFIFSENKKPQLSTAGIKVGKPFTLASFVSFGEVIACHVFRQYVAGSEARFVNVCFFAFVEFVESMHIVPKL